MTGFDQDPLGRRARELHARSLEAMSPRVRAQLQLRLQAAVAPRPSRVRGRDWRWAAAPAFALALAFALPRLGVQPPGGDAAAAQVAFAAATAAEAPVVPLEQDPEFYAWLASADAVALASE